MVTADRYTIVDVHILGCEKFLRIDVAWSDALAPADWRDYLDETGVIRLGVVGSCRAYTARIRIAWRDAAAREECALHERTMPGNRAGGRRWDDVQRYTEMLVGGSAPPSGPVFADVGQPLLFPIDGARRMMAAAELGLPEIDAVVLVAA